MSTTCSSALRSALAATAIITTSLLLAGCSSAMGPGSMGKGDGNSSQTTAARENGASGPHNDADQAFAMEMVPHHQQAVEMVDMLLKKTGVDARVVAIARQIKSEQDPEIATMKSWLTAWGSPKGGMSGMHDGTGMMSDSDMTALDAATGAAASTLFLQQMVQHHQGAIDMATAETSDGKSVAAIALAKNIVASQTTEIATMQSLLKSL